MVAPDEGHGFARPVNNMAMIAKAEKFLAKHLGGRYQESMTPEVTKRLSEITVDPKTVTLGSPVSSNAAPAADLSGKWSMFADAGGQQIVISLELKQTGAGFTGSLSSPMGGGTIANGKVSGKNMTGTLKADVNGQLMEIELAGTIDGTSMSGSMSGASIPPITFTASKDK
jgi:hypothetical protein